MNEPSISIKMGFCQLWCQMKYYQICLWIWNFEFLAGQIFLYFLLHKSHWSKSKITILCSLEARDAIGNSILISIWQISNCKLAGGFEKRLKRFRIWKMHFLHFALHSHFIKHCAHFAWYHIFRQIFHSELFCAEFFCRNLFQICFHS